MEGMPVVQCEPPYHPWSDPLTLGRPPWGEALQEAFFDEADPMPWGAPAQLNMNHFQGDATIVLPPSESLRVGRYLWIDVVAETTQQSTDRLEQQLYTVRLGRQIEFRERHGVYQKVSRHMLSWLGRAGFLEIRAYVANEPEKPAAPQSRTRCLFIRHSQAGLDPVIPEADGDVIDLRRLERPADSPLPHLRVEAGPDATGCREGWLEAYSPHGHAFGRFSVGGDNRLPLLLNENDAGKVVIVYFHTIYPRMQGQLASISTCRRLDVVTGREW